MTPSIAEHERGHITCASLLKAGGERSAFTIACVTSLRTRDARMYRIYPACQFDAARHRRPTAEMCAAGPR